MKVGQTLIIHMMTIVYILGVSFKSSATNGRSQGY